MKLFAVFKREYFQVVRKKSFLLLTVLAPFLLGGLVIVPAMIAVRGLGAKHVAFLDGTASLSEAIQEEQKRELQAASEPSSQGTLGRRDRASSSLRLTIDYVPPGRELETTLRGCLARLHARATGAEHLDGVFVVPADARTNPQARLSYYTESATDFVTEERLARLANRALFRVRLEARGVPSPELDRLLQSAPVESVRISATGAQKKGGELNFLGAFVFVLLLLLPMLIYGQEIMRGIVQEKSDRVVEILVSSMSAMELLTGKVLGLAAVGLTQIAIWLAMAAAAVGSAASLAALSGSIRIGQFLNVRVLLFFVVFYVLGYLVYACVYAVGGAVSNSDKEAQQVLAPVVVIIMMPWLLAMPIIQNPQSGLAVVLSLVPVFTPITMFMRIVVSEPPAWQIALSIALSVGTIYVLFLATAKIFRVGILSYGKRPTIPELWKWLKLA